MSRASACEPEVASQEKAGSAAVRRPIDARTSALPCVGQGDVGRSNADGPHSAQPARAASVASACVLALLLLADCAEPAEPCAAIGYGPGNLTIVDSAGKLVPDAKVTKRVNGGPEEAAFCGQRLPDGGCMAWWLGPIGSTAFRATRADGSSAVEKTIVVANLGPVDCPRPEQEDFELVLPD